MKALMKSPIVVALNAPPDLFYYGGGVYSSNLDMSKKAYDRHVCRGLRAICTVRPSASSVCSRVSDAIGRATRKWAVRALQGGRQPVGEDEPRGRGSWVGCRSGGERRRADEVLAD